MNPNILLAIKLFILILAVIIGCLAYLHFEMPRHQTPVAPAMSQSTGSNSNTGLWKSTPPKPVTITNPFPNAN